jgi:hypothetical protein
MEEIEGETDRSSPDALVTNVEGGPYHLCRYGSTWVEFGACRGLIQDLVNKLFDNILKVVRIRFISRSLVRCTLSSVSRKNCLLIEYSW